ncbi:MAG TPA: tetratricopeptide repeat protein [Desulfitobacteriaceae bacterium]|nr:tetratricopeptide repeat protein [Desulfitobacteriaceae bacterium]
MFKTKGEKREETHKQIEQLAAAGRFEEALRLCESELEKKPNARQFMEDEADILAKMGKYQEAEELYDALLRRDPKNNVYREKKGDLFQAQGRFEEAYECYPFISYGRIFITLLICEAVGAFLTYCGYWLMVNPYASNFLQILGGGWMIVFFIGLFVSPFATAKPMFRIKRRLRR